VSIAAATILDEAASLLLDRTHRTWPAADLLGYLNEAMRTTAFVKPDFYTVQNFVTLVAGVLQNLPADGVALLKITRNASGRIVTQVDEGLLDEASRFWPAGTQETVIEHYTADPRNPRRFTVFPPSDGTSSIELLYGAVPPQIMYPEEELPVPSSYHTALLNFVLAKAYSKNSKRQDLTKSSGFMQQWGQLLGLKSQAQIAAAPRVTAQQGTTS
jgi:hypothetical protein